MDQETILITWGAGYIGSHAVVAFEQLGYRTITVDNYVNSSEITQDRIARILGYAPIFIQGDIIDSDFLDSVFSQYRFSGVIHFAWLKAVGESTQSPFLYYRNNIDGSACLLETMDRYGVRNIVFSSSATVYSPDGGVEYSENHPLGTTNPYGTTKLVIEYLLRDMARHKAFNVISLRYFNPIGAHPSWFIGENPSGVPNNLLPYILDVASKKRELVRIFGDDYDTPDGTGVRDYIDVNDLVDAHLLAYRKLPALSGEFVPVNIGTGRGTSVLQMIKTVEKVTWQHVPYEVVGRRPGDLPIYYAWTHFAKQFLNWEPKRSVAESVAHAWKFITNWL